MKTKRTSLLEWLDQWPPFMVFALARRRNGVGGQFPKNLSQRTFRRLSTKLSWERVKVWQIDAFCRFCGVNLFCMNSNRYYLRRTWQSSRPLAHLSRTQLREFNLLCGRLLALRERRARASAVA